MPFENNPQDLFVPVMARYILKNRKSYVFSAITASVDGEVVFESLGNEGDSNRIGSLRIPMDSKFIINDGQHRRAAIEQALQEEPQIGDEHIAVVFFIDVGLEHCQQMFADLNRYAIRPSTSLGLLYDHRDEAAQLSKRIGMESEVFRDVVETEKSSLSVRSRKLFTLSAIHFSTIDMFEGIEDKEDNELVGFALEYWKEVDKTIPEWRLVRESKMTSGEVRQSFLHSHGIALQALGRFGNCMMQLPKSQWKKYVKSLSGINWSRSNKKLWEGRAMIGGRISKSGQNITLTLNALKKNAGIELKPEEQAIEEAFKRGRPNCTIKNCSHLPKQ